MDASAFNRLGDGLAFVFAILLITTPLGIWKLVEVVIWLFKHFRIHFV